MTKEELYKGIVDLYKKTGQGLIYLPSIDRNIVDELVEDGLVKVITTPYSYLPNDVTICLTKGYCVEEDMLNDGDTRFLTYMRIYLNIEEIVDLGEMDKLTLNDAIRDVGIMSGYSTWLSENKSSLDEMENIEYLEEVELTLDDEHKGIVTGKSWYSDDISLQDGILKIDKYISISNQMIELSNKLLQIYNGSTSYQNDIIESENKIINCKDDIKKHNKILTYLKKQDNSKKLCEVI